MRNFARIIAEIMAPVERLTLEECDVLRELSYHVDDPLAARAMREMAETGEAE
jgi:hypothetical protein